MFAIVGAALAVLPARPPTAPAPPAGPSASASPAPVTAPTSFDPLRLMLHLTEQPQGMDHTTQEIPAAFTPVRNTVIVGNGE
ncbi:hypothetical protein R8Z50_22485 [Longispora sp. K20-0274]|uniref:hypothetical protein n=1 Tax=Longispora sp. K20-0274 TaxID=3088255 RepID=UPI00399ABFE2